MLKRVLLGSVIALTVLPAHAALRLAFSVGGSTFACVDGAACDGSALPGVITLGLVTLGDVTIFGTIAADGTSPDHLNVANLTISNSGSGLETLKAAFSDNNFTGLSPEFKTSASGTWNGTSASDANFEWWVNSLNVEGASTSTDTPGVGISPFSDTASAGPNAFSFNATTGLAHLTPYAITEGAIFDLASGAVLVGNSEAFVAVPEPPAWAMILAGFGLMGLAGSRVRRRLVV